MGKSNLRDLYFNKYIKNQPTPQAYIQALQHSPYRTHNRMAVLLGAKLQELQREREQNADSEAVQTRGADDSGHN